MSIHINRFIDKIKTLENKQAKQLTMTMREAKDLHGDITKLLLALQELQLLMQKQQEESAEVQQVEISGGDFLSK